MQFVGLVAILAPHIFEVSHQIMQLLVTNANKLLFVYVQEIKGYTHPLSLNVFELSYRLPSHQNVVCV